MNAILSLGLGYFVGCISPAAWVSKKKNVDLKQEGTKNLGATNTAFVLGKAAGIFVLVFDIAKSFFSYKIAKLLFPYLRIAGILACIGCILGHCFPVFMHFQGGKGLAAFGGLILAYSPWMFLTIITIGIILMILCNTGVVAPLMGCVVFPVMVFCTGHDLVETLAVAAASTIIMMTHWSNFRREKEKNDLVKTDEFLTKVFKKKK